tara:strand:+ start:62203 stop:62826 length:624 start_codon:yes stop_codon:yes gene_type:complete
MKLSLDSVGKRFNQQLVFKGLDHEFSSASKTAILGSNGSGKSTLIKILSHSLSPTEGKIKYFNSDGSEIPATQIPFQISLAAPYLELIEELSAYEFLNFYQKFKPLIEGIDTAKFLEICYLENSKNKEIKKFSSGMKQRFRLGLAFLSDVSLILLDEPSSNLDAKGMAWYKELITKYLANRTLIIGSNYSADEIEVCDERVEIERYS